ncbi:MAG: MobF family relaxase [Gammaproteobacteria bacterium]
MLSTSVIKNASDASHYYSARDNYYTKEEGIEQSEWYGKGAQKLNLSGEVDPNQFTELLQGKLPHGEVLGKRVDGEIKHRAGWDLTFSAPKSISIIALVCGDKRLIEAHREAVKAALSEIERGCSEARIKMGSDISYQNTKNIIAALYHHDLSREQDPQLHTHCVVMNMTERSDGRFRSQASKMGRYDKEASNEIHGFIERVRHNKRYFGKIYEAELAYQVKELGYDIVINPKTGVFEIVGVPEVVSDHFSKRRNKIEKHLAENGFTGGKAADFATINTRQNKKSVDRSDLTESWRNEANQLGLNTQLIIEKSHEALFSHDKQKSHKVEDIDKNAIGILKAASKEISQFKTIFLLEEVVTLAAQYAILEKINVNTLLNATEHLVKSGEFITIHNESGKTQLMDKMTLDIEKQIKQNLSENKSFHAAIPKNTLNHYLDQHSELSDEIKLSLRDTFSDNRFVLIEGERAREDLSKPIIQLANTFKLDVSIVSPTQIISKRFAESVKKVPIPFGNK